MSGAQPMPWTLRFTAWQCGHHGQRPDDIPVASPEQAKLILDAIGYAISQPGSARACLFSDVVGFADIYLTDDYCSFNPDATPSARPAAVLCADDAMVAAILAPELKDARNDLMDPDLWDVTVWDGKRMVYRCETVLTTLTRDAVQELANVDDSYLDPRSPLFDLPPVLHDGAALLERLRTVAAEIAAYEAEIAADRAVNANGAENAPSVEGGAS